MAKKENQGFICKNCNKIVQPLSNGSYRNHCPFCLYSLHVDDRMGDRQSKCKGLMRPVSYRKNSQKGWQIQHRCLICDKEQWNIVATNTIQEDFFIEWIQTKIVY